MYKLIWSVDRVKNELSDQDKSNIFNVMKEKAKSRDAALGFSMSLDDTEHPKQMVVEFINSVENCVCELIDVERADNLYVIVVAQNKPDLERLIHKLFA